MSVIESLPNKKIFQDAQKAHAQAGEDDCVGGKMSFRKMVEEILKDNVNLSWLEWNKKYPNKSVSDAILQAAREELVPKGTTKSFNSASTSQMEGFNSCRQQVIERIEKK